MSATWNLIYFCFDILFSHSLMEHKEWGRGGGEVGGETDYYFVHSLWFFSPIMACESSVPFWGLVWFFKWKWSSRLFHSVSIKCDWDFEGAWNKPVSRFSWSKGVSRNKVQSFSLVALHTAPVNRPGQICLGFYRILVLPKPTTPLHVVSEELHLHIEIKRPAVINRHILNNKAKKNHFL